MKRIVFLIVLCFELCATPISKAQEEQVGLRLIAVKTSAEAASLRLRIQGGASFEELAKAHSIGPSASTGGFIGLMRPSDLRREFQTALEGVKPGQISAVTSVDGEFLLLQRLSLEESGWIVSNDAGVEAFDAGRYDAAVQSFRQALQYAEKLTPADYRLEDSLHGLAESYRLQKKYSEAEPVYRRYLAVHWGGPSAPDVLDRFSAVLALAYFRDSQFSDTLRKFEEALNRAPLAEEVYQGMAGILFKAQLMPEAEAVMARAAALFPASKDVQYYQAQLYRSSLNPRKALELFERLSRMKSPADVDSDLDRLQQSVVYQKIGSIRAELVEFDEAASAYKKALEILPTSLESRTVSLRPTLRTSPPTFGLQTRASESAASTQPQPRRPESCRSNPLTEEHITCLLRLWCGRGRKRRRRRNWTCIASSKRTRGPKSTEAATSLLSIVARRRNCSKAGMKKQSACSSRRSKRILIHQPIT